MKKLAIILFVAGLAQAHASLVSFTSAITETATGGSFIPVFKFSIGDVISGTFVVDSLTGEVSNTRLFDNGVEFVDPDVAIFDPVACHFEAFVNVGDDFAARVNKTEAFYAFINSGGDGFSNGTARVLTFTGKFAALVPDGGSTLALFTVALLTLLCASRYQRV